GAVVSRVQGQTQRLVDFQVFCPKVLAGIGDLPSTVADRSIPIRLAWKKRREPTARPRPRAFQAGAVAPGDAPAAWAAHAARARRCGPPLSLDESVAWRRVLAEARDGAAASARGCAWDSNILIFDAIFFLTCASRGCSERSGKALSTCLVAQRRFPTNGRGRD